MKLNLYSIRYLHPVTLDVVGDQVLAVSLFAAKEKVRKKYHFAPAQKDILIGHLMKRGTDTRKHPCAVK